MGLETVELLMDVEDRFHIRVPNAAATACITVADLQAVIVELLVAQGRQRDDLLRQDVWEGIMTILIENGIDVADIRPDSKWVGDITEYG